MLSVNLKNVVVCYSSQNIVHFDSTHLICALTEVRSCQGWTLREYIQFSMFTALPKLESSWRKSDLEKSAQHSTATAHQFHHLVSSSFPIFLFILQLFQLHHQGLFSSPKIRNIEINNQMQKYWQLYIFHSQTHFILCFKGIGGGLGPKWGFYWFL